MLPLLVPTVSKHRRVPNGVLGGDVTREGDWVGDVGHLTLADSALTELLIDMLRMLEYGHLSSIAEEPDPGLTKVAACISASMPTRHFVRMRVGVLGPPPEQLALFAQGQGAAAEASDPADIEISSRVHEDEAMPARPAGELPQRAAVTRCAGGSQGQEPFDVCGADRGPVLDAGLGGQEAA